MPKTKYAGKRKRTYKRKSTSVVKSLLRRLTNSTEVSRLSTVGHRVLVLFLIMILLLLSTLMQQYLKVQETTLLELATRLLPVP